MFPLTQNLPSSFDFCAFSSEVERVCIVFLYVHAMVYNWKQGKLMRAS